MLRLCNALTCDHRCGAYHAAVEDSIDQVVHEVWGRRFQSMEGQVLPATRAHLFLAFLRIASPALSDLLQVNVEGVYMEPRSTLLAPLMRTMLSFGCQGPIVRRLVTA